jgi:L-ribulokinase
VLLWPVNALLDSAPKIDGATLASVKSHLSEQMIPALSAAAERIPASASGIVALDWLNGRRTPFADQRLQSAIAGLDLGADAPRIFRSLVEATAFGAKSIVDRFGEEGVPIKGVIALGGVAKKSPFVMQVHADVLNMPLRIARAEQACALGAAMCAAVAAGIHPTFGAAQQAMGNGFEREYHPIAENVVIYRELYRRYMQLGKFAEATVA